MIHTKAIEYILFDLDNTLYSAGYGLEKAVNRRINQYISGYLGLPPEAAWALRRERIASRGYGTTLEWLMAEKGFEPCMVDEYYDLIHPENEADTLPPDHELGSFLVSLGLPMAIMTNSPKEHALRVIKKLGMQELFPSIFDIRFNGLKGKPHAEAFTRVLDAIGKSPERCLFVDDSRPYVEGYRALGGPGVFFDEFDEHPEFPGPRINSLKSLIGLRELSFS
ncbi:MAG: HAD-IA family hydrolase [Treponema sp.]|jgi:putative hydrolase of the HAD superfamily|nr:HAD-IA family hydrolase [Treponema sp.]